MCEYEWLSLKVSARASSVPRNLIELRAVRAELDALDTFANASAATSESLSRRPREPRRTVLLNGVHSQLDDVLDQYQRSRFYKNFLKNFKKLSNVPNIGRRSAFQLVWPFQIGILDYLKSGAGAFVQHWHMRRLAGAFPFPFFPFLPCNYVPIAASQFQPEISRLNRRKWVFGVKSFPPSRKRPLKCANLTEILKATLSRDA